MAENCRVSEAVSEVVAGVSVIATGGLRVRMALADLVGAAALVAVTATVCTPVMDVGDV